MKRFLIPIILMTVFATADAQKAKTVSADKPEKIVTFIKTQHTTDWYAKQAKLWDAEIKKNPNNDDAWLNSFRATRYKILFQVEDDYYRGKTEIVEQPDYSPLKDYAVRLAKERPNSYARYIIDYYCERFVNGYECEDNMLKAIKMRPDADDEEIYADYVSYLLQHGETDLMAEILKKWYNTGVYSYNILSYSYNVLAGMEPGGILFVNGDTQTYSSLLIKYGKDLFKDKTIICVGLFAAPGYLDNVCKELGIEMEIEPKPFTRNYITDDYRRWTCKIFEAIAQKTGRPVYFSTFLSEANDYKFQQNVYSEGLVNKYSTVKYDNLAVKRRNFEEVYLTDYLYETFVPETYNATAYKINLNYLPCFRSLLEYYRKTGNKAQEEKLYNMLKHILDKSKDLLDDDSYKYYYNEIKR